MRDIRDRGVFANLRTMSIVGELNCIIEAFSEERFLLRRSHNNVLADHLLFIDHRASSLSAIELRTIW